MRASLDPVDRADEALQSVVPEQPNKPYDIRDIIGRCSTTGISSRSRRTTRPTS